MKLLTFFAMGEDLLPVFQHIEANQPVKYVPAGQLIGRTYDTFRRGIDLPNLGKASGNQHVACDRFLVSARDLPIILEPLKTISEDDVNRTSIVIAGQAFAVENHGLKALIGVDRFAIDQRVNADTVILNVGGLWNGEVLLHGSVGTASRSEPSQQLMRRFKNAFREHFVTVRRFYVGPTAFEFLKTGKRLTAAVNSPREFDLRPP